MVSNSSENRALPFMASSHSSSGNGVRTLPIRMSSEGSLQITANIHDCCLLSQIHGTCESIVGVTCKRIVGLLSWALLPDLQHKVIAHSPLKFSQQYVGVLFRF